MSVTIDDVRELAQTLPRSYEALVRDRVKFRVGRLGYRSGSPPITWAIEAVDAGQAGSGYGDERGGVGASLAGR